MAPLPLASPFSKGYAFPPFKSRTKSSPFSRFESSLEEGEGEAIRLTPLAPDPRPILKPDTPSSRFPSAGLSRPWYKPPFKAPPKPEKKVEWGFTGLSESDEYKETMLNPWSYRHKRSLEGQEPPATTVSATGIGALGQEEPGRCLLTFTQEISLLVFTWLAALLICGVIVWIIAKIERKLYRLVERGAAGLGEKKGWRRVLYCVGYSSAVFAIIAMLLTLIAVMCSLKELLCDAIWGA